MHKRGLRLMPANLKLRMACVAAFLVFVATLMVTLSTLAVAERGMKSVIGDQQDTMLAGAAAYMDNSIAARIAQLETLAERLPRASLQDPALARRVLVAQAPLWNEDYLNLVLLDTQGQQVASVLDFGDGQRLDARGLDYFEKPLASGRGHVSDPFNSRVSKRYVVVMSAPVLGPDGKVSGVLAASLDLRESGFLRQVSGLKPGASGYLFLMTADGTMIDHPDRKRLLQAATPNPTLEVSAERAAQGFEGWIEATGRDGRPSIYAYRRMQTTGWILGARYPSDEAFAPLEKMRHNAIFGALGLALAAGVLAWVLVFRLLAPLEVLRDRIRAIRHDGADIGVLREARSDEIGELGNAFHALMAEREEVEGLRAASEKRLRLITDNLPVLIAYLDRDQRFRFGNATFERWFGVTPRQLVGMSIAELMGEDAARQGAASLEGAFAGRGTTCQMRLTIRGAPRVLEGVYIPDVQPDGSVAGVYALKHDMTHVKEVEEQLSRLARSDTLTGLANRRSFNETLPQALVRAARRGQPLALAYLDVDHFKRINDSHGHGVGDEVLKEFGERLRASVRASDTPARLSGDEFVVILEEAGTREEAERIAAKIVAAMRVPFATGAGLIPVTASVGVALSSPGQDEEALLAAADQALYAAKANGRDGFVVGSAASPRTR